MKILTSPKQEIIAKLVNVAVKFDPKKEKYLLSYPYFISYFQNLESIELENLVIGISATYSWMPTILKNLNLKNSDKALKILNCAKKGEILSVSDLLLLKITFNNSLVGTSKLLHFINPEVYAIWDSRVYRFLNNNEKPYKHKLEKPEMYLQYLKFIESLKDEDSFDDFYLIMNSKVGFNITKSRALELAFFKGDIS